MTTDALPADIRLVVNTRYGITIEATTDSAIHWLESDPDWSPDSTDRPWSAHADTAVGVVVALDAQRIGSGSRWWTKPASEPFTWMTAWDESGPVPSLGAGLLPSGAISVPDGLHQFSP